MDVLVEKGEFLGVALEAHTASEEVCKLDKRWVQLEGRVGLDVIDIIAGGAVDRHNQERGPLQINKRDQIVMVDGAKDFATAKRPIDKDGIVVRFAVMRGSGVTLRDLKPEKGRGQPCPSSNMYSSNWNSGCPTFRCSEEGCHGTLRVWCMECVDKVNQGIMRAKKHPMKGVAKILEYYGWRAFHKCMSMSTCYFYCPVHAQRSPTDTPCFYKNLRDDAGF